MGSYLTAVLPLVLAGAADDGAVERTWAGWLVGLVPAIVIIGVAYFAVRRIRRQRR